jgi:FkbH-like protein
MEELKYSEILRRNKELAASMKGPAYKVDVLSNIITSQFNEVFEYNLRSEGINANVNSGDYDNILQDAVKCNNSDLIIIFWEAANLIDGLQYKAGSMKEEELETLISKTCSEIDFVLKSLEGRPLIIFNKFSSLIFNHSFISKNNFDILCSRLNEFLVKKASSNLLIIETDKIFAELSIAKSVDFRFYYSSKALYTIDFYKTYTKYILPVIKSIKGKAKKALVFDCDNTLWKGVIGEDGMENIEMSGKGKKGVVFEEIQHLALDLSKKGVIIGLCSKNNLEDVEGVFKNHPDISLKNEHIVIKKINWDDKASNIRKIAQELNIGLDSIVFIDDSDFELEFINDQLPDVKTLKVPANLYEYSQLLRSNLSLFYSFSQSTEDLKRVDMYKQEAERINQKASFENIESYLSSLELRIIVHVNPSAFAARISQLSQKTNQFNLTTKRYTESDIARFINTKDFLTFAFEVQDKFGDSGVTGVLILRTDLTSKTAEIDSFLMSCRVIGRNIEIAFFTFLIEYLEKSGITKLYAKYSKTLKNEQVSDFYEKIGFICTESSEKEKVYELKLVDYMIKQINYINIEYGTKN